MFSIHRHARLCLVPCCLLLCTLTPILAQVPDMSFRVLDYRDGLPEHFLTSEIQQDHLGRIWLATDKGLFMFDGNEVTGFSPRIPDTTTITESIVNSLMADQNDQIWIGTRNMGFCVYDPVKNIFRRYLPVSLGGRVPSPRIWGMIQSDDGTVWMCSRPGLIKCDPETMTFEHFLVPIEQLVEDVGFNDPDFVNTMRDLKFDPRNPDLLWIGTRAGLVSFHVRDEVFEIHDMPVGSRDLGLDSRNYLLMDLTFLGDEDLWAATWSGGLAHFNTRTRTWTSYNEPDVNQQASVIYDIAVQDADALLYASRHGTGIFDVRSKTWSSFPTDRVKEGGIRASNYYFQVWVSRDSTLIVAGSTGLNIGRNQTIASTWQTSARPILTGISVNDQPAVLPESPVYTSQLLLNKRENDLNFTVSWPVLDPPGDIAYRFMLSGHDDQWVLSDDSRTMRYTDLSPGNYTFSFAARVDGGAWVPGHTDLEIAIQRPLLNHPLVLGSLGVLILGIFGSVYHLRVTYIQREERIKQDFSKRLAENEMKALRAQMNPHFMFNSLNSVKNYILKEDTEAASKYLTKFSQLMRAILRNSESTLITLNNELQALRLYIEIEARRFRSAFSYNISVADDIDPARVLVPPLLIQPYVENAIWHGLMLKEGERTLQIHIGKHGRNMKIAITDNGIGRKAATALAQDRPYKKESFGMKITHDRIALIKSTLGIDAHADVQDLYDRSGAATGTRVTISIPLIFNNDEPVNETQSDESPVN